MEEIKKALQELGRHLIWYRDHRHPGSGDLVQQNTKDGISQLTDFVPKMTVAELIKCTGNNGVGLGTLWNDKGKVTCEVTVINGKAYVSEGDFLDTGNTREAKPDEMVYFAQVGYFEPEVRSHKIDKNSDYIKNHPKFNRVA